MDLTKLVVGVLIVSSRHGAVVVLSVSAVDEVVAEVQRRAQFNVDC